ncbi:hypothetical protein ACWIUD_02395 [Helicobacter sp. 23-1044]
MIFDFLQKRRARIKAKNEALKLLDENTAKIITNLVRISVIERDKEARFAVWEREIVAWLGEIYRKCENLKYDGKITYGEYDEAIKNAFWNPKIVYETALYGFDDRDLYESDKDLHDSNDGYNHKRITYIRHNERDIYHIKLILSHQFCEMCQLQWAEKTFTRYCLYLDLKLRMP